MLDSLGSTLSAQTLDGFFARFGKNPDSEELTFDEAVQCAVIMGSRGKGAREGE